MIKFALNVALMLIVPFYGHTWHNQYIASLSPSVPMIDVGYMRGTGFYVQSPKGHSVFLTAAHICKNFEPGVFMTRISTKSDVCSVKVKAVAPLLKMAKSYANFEPVWVFGYPLGQTLTITEGAFAGILKKEDSGYPIDAPVITATALPGNSGSPVLDVYGHVVGLVSAIIPGTNRTIIVSLDDLKEFLKDE